MVSSTFTILVGSALIAADLLSLSALPIPFSLSEKKFIIHYLQPHSPYLSLPTPSVSDINCCAYNTRAREEDTFQENAKTYKREKIIFPLVFLSKKMGIFGGNPRCRRKYEPGGTTS